MLILVKVEREQYSALGAQSFTPSQLDRSTIYPTLGADQLILHFVQLLHADGAHGVLVTHQEIHRRT